MATDTLERGQQMQNRSQKPKPLPGVSMAAMEDMEVLVVTAGTDLEALVATDTLESGQQNQSQKPKAMDTVATLENAQP